MLRDLSVGPPGLLAAFGPRLNLVWASFGASFLSPKPSLVRLFAACSPTCSCLASGLPLPCSWLAPAFLLPHYLVLLAAALQAWFKWLNAS